MIKKQPKREKISVRLSADVRKDMELVAKRYGMSLKYTNRPSN